MTFSVFLILGHSRFLSLARSGLNCLIGVTIANLAAAVAGCSGEPTGPINALANHCQAPKIVRLAHQVVPIYPDRYDWQEDVRVRKAFEELWKQDGEQLWPRLIAHISDPNYAFTRRDEEDMEGFTRNLTVGELCEMVARTDLLKPIVQPFRGIITSRPAKQRDLFKVFAKISEPPELRDLKAWYQARSSRPLYQLQIELCQWAIEEMRRQDTIDSDLKSTYIADLTKEIENLTNTKIPEVTGRLPFTERYSYFDVAKANQIRQRYLAEQCDQNMSH
jgi:hypothetical protein